MSTIPFTLLPIIRFILLKKVGIKTVVKKKTPFLTPRHKKARLEFALAHKDWSADDWRQVVWTDKTKINRLGSDGGGNGCGKSQGKASSVRVVSGAVKSGGVSVMIQGCRM